METNNKQAHHSKRRKWLLPFLLSSLLVFVFLAISTSSNRSTLHSRKARVNGAETRPRFAEASPKLGSFAHSNDPIPRLAYLISGSVGDGESLKRALKALYHPRNQYVVHLDLEASASERLDLAEFVRRERVFAEVGNVRMIVKANLVTYRGPTMVTNTLHAAAILLKEGGEWDWFINLSASDYPLVTQDDLLHTLSTIPRNLNFIEHTSNIGWKESHRARPIIIDPGLYSLEKSDVFWLPEKRGVPTAYRLFTGSAWMMLSRSFIEFCIWGWDNLPRIVLMYYANFLSSPEGYFHTVICNSPEYKNTTVNHDLHFISWDNPPQQHPHFLTAEDFPRMVESNAPFARKFSRNDTVRDRVDFELLGFTTTGGWPGEKGFGGRNGTRLRPGPGAERLRKLVDGLLKAEDFRGRQCA